MSGFERYCSNHIGCCREFGKEARPKLHPQVRVIRVVLNDDGVVSQGIQPLRLVRPSDARHAPILVRFESHPTVLLLEQLNEHLGVVESPPLVGPTAEIQAAAGRGNTERFIGRL